MWEQKDRHNSFATMKQSEAENMPDGSYLSVINKYMSKSLGGKGAGTDIQYKVPMYNLLFTYYEMAADTPDWSQITSVLYVVAVVNTLMLALVVTIYSAIDYEENFGTVMRFSHGSNHPEHLNNTQIFAESGFFGPDALDVNKFNEGATYLDFPVPGCMGYNASRDCLKVWEAAGNNISGWFGANLDPRAEGSPLYPWCKYPCFADRPYDGGIDGSNFVSGQYALAWAIRQLYDNDASKIDITDVTMPVVQSPIDDFARATWQSFVLLAAGLSITVLTIGTSAPNVFAREQVGASFGYQYRTIMKSYLYWIRWTILLAFILTVAGIIRFIQVNVYIVYSKWTDGYVLENGQWPDGIMGGIRRDAPFAFVNSLSYMFFYLPMFVMLLILSIGIILMYSYPKDSLTNINATKIPTTEWTWRNLIPCLKSSMTQSLEYKRNVHTDDMNDLLEMLCGIPKTGSVSQDHLVEQHDGGECGSMVRKCWKCGKPDDVYGPRQSCCFCFAPNQTFPEDKGIFLAGAGGMPLHESEVVADTLVDAGFYDVRSILRLVLPPDLGGLGHGSKLFEIENLQKGVVLSIIKGITRFAWTWAVEITQDFVFSDSFHSEYKLRENDKQWLVRRLTKLEKTMPKKDAVEYVIIPEFLYLYMRAEVDNHESPKTLQIFKYFLENNQYHVMPRGALSDGWERIENHKFKGGAPYKGVVYRKHVKYWDDGSSVTPAESGRNSAAFKNVCQNAVLAWWMVRLAEHNVDPDDPHSTRCKMRIPDSSLFPKENGFVMEWLFDSDNFKDDDVTNAFLHKNFLETRPHRISPFHPDTIAPSFGMSKPSPELEELRKRAKSSCDYLFSQGIQMSTASR